MEYIASLGTTILYLNPISKSFSSHRYDTGDYKTPDPMLGTEEDFKAMCKAAHDRGIRVILDGVYSHTGSDSLYFDKNGSFGGKGAYCDPDSPYRSWYTFHHYPDTYESWWGFKTLPTVRKLDPAFVQYIIEAEDSVIAHWLGLGADGFRLDVADELPNEFVDKLKKRLRSLRPDGLLMGEVWEDASNKISYDVRRRYFVDGTLDSVMNYPFRKAILDYVRGADDGRGFREAVLTVAENYPTQVLCCNMNLLGTHDTPRILTALVDTFDGSREELAARKLTPEQLRLALERLQLATVLQYTLPGCPSVYYGDEVGMEGGKDPFNRRPYPWGRENAALLAHYRSLGALRRAHMALQQGSIDFLHAEAGRLAYMRKHGGEEIRIYVNQNQDPWTVAPGKLLMGQSLQQVSGEAVILQPGGWCMLED
jgi:glycosidase